MAIIESLNYIILHTEGTAPEDDVSFQKAAWSMEKRTQNLANAVRICQEAGIDASQKMAVIGFNQADNTVRIVDRPDEDVFEKVAGNILITDKKNLVLEGWASDCCLVAMVADDGDQVCVLHASVNTFRNGVIQRAIAALRERGAHRIEAFVGACAGACCYEYGSEKAKEDFSGYEDFILPSDKEGKVFLDLYGAISSAVEQCGATAIDIFSSTCRCNICSKRRDGSFMFPSFRRDVDEEGKHVNGQYGLFIVKI